MPKINSLSAEESKEDKGLIGSVWFYRFTDFDQNSTFVCLIIWRLIQAIFLTKNMVHPDEYWQATQPAYNMVYGGVSLSWEWH